MLYRIVFFTLCILFSQIGFANEVVNAQLPIDLSPQSLYQNAHVIVKAVVILLLLCSIITWAIFLLKLYQLFIGIKAIKKDRVILSNYNSFDKLTANKDLNFKVANLFINEMNQEIIHSQSYFDEDIKARISYRLERQIKQLTMRMKQGISILATIGSVSPFIGLFGTVWGIMNSFIGIAQTRTTDLYAVAPGIAEALFATALGLVAAIPAVVIYNIFVRVIQHYSEQLNSITALLQLALRRDISLKN